MKLYEKYHNNLDFRVISGGMILSYRIGPISEVASYIKGAYKDVELATNIVFGREFLTLLEEGTTIFTSLPAAIAMAIFREKYPEMQIHYSKAIQQAIYFDGSDPSNLDMFARIASTFGFDINEFKSKFNTQKAIDTAKEDFITTQSFRINGFPTLVLKMQNNYQLISKGYTSYNVLDQILSKLTY